MMRLPEAGESFGRYRLERVLGRGGMGVVYAAHDTTLGRDVALKLIAPQFAEDAGFRSRFQREAATLAKLDSPHVVSIFDHGEHDGVLFIVTQLVDGGDLLQQIHRHGAMPPALAVDVVAQAALGLCHAHAAGVVHRDIKPGNVLLRGRGQEVEALLCDFGIAASPGTELSRTGSAAGSLPYMAPERHRGEDAGPSGDVYAAGCLLWHALTGTAPYAGTDVEVALGHIQGPIPQLPGKDDFSLATNAFLRRAMAKDPRKRLPTARALHAELVQLLGTAPDAVALPGATSFRQPITLPTAQRRWLPGVLAAVATAAVVTGTLFAAGVVGSGSDSTAGQRQGAPGTPSMAAKVINERPSLVPDTSTKSAAAWDTTSEAEAGEVPRTRGKVAGPDDDGPAVSNKPRRKREKRDTTPKKTLSAPPPPTNHYRCWNGNEVPAYEDCTRPVGWTGASYIFLDLPNLSDCRKKSQPDSGNMVESWGCRFFGGGTKQNWVTISRWNSVRNAKSFYGNWFQNLVSSAAWMRGDRRFGVAMSGRKGPNGGRFGVVRIYENEPWTVSANVANKSARGVFYERFNQYRYPNWLRGYKFQ